MLSALLRFSLERRALVLVAAATLVVVGIYRAASMPMDVFPDLTAPRVTVVTEVSGLASEEVEKLVTYPIEAAVNGTAGLRRVRSASAPGISVVWAEFDWATSGVVARQLVTERLQSIAGALPPEASAPLLAPASSVMGEIAFVALTSETLSGLEVRRIADVVVRRRLLSVGGVSQVVPIGGEVKQYQVILDPYALGELGLTADDVVHSIAEGTKNAAGGYLLEGGQESVIRVLGRAQSVTDLENLVVANRDQTPIFLRSVASVRVGPAVARGTASFNGKPAVLLSIVKQPDADTTSTTARLDRALDELGETLAARGAVLQREVFRQQDFIDRAIENLLRVLRDGAILVIGVLWLFLWSLRPTLISAAAIPLSLLASVLLLDLLGLTLDTMTLGGLAIAIGELVDDAIVDVENVSRRLRERAALPAKEQPSVTSTVFRASLEIRSAIVSATVILVLVFLPLLTLGGLDGRLLRPLAIAYLAAIFASLLVALTVTPVLCSLVLSRGKSSYGRESPVMARLTRGYAPLLEWSLARPRQILLAALILVVVGVGALFGLGRSFLPEFNEGSLTINMVLAPGTALDESNALARMAENALLDDPGVLSVGRRTGRAERDEHVLGVETTEMEVRVAADDERTREELFHDIRERLRVVPAQFTLGQPISHRIEHMISGQRTALAIKIFGDDLATLRSVGERVHAALQDDPGLVDLGLEQIVDIPQLVVKVDPRRAASHGLSAGMGAREVGTALWGRTAAAIYEDGTTTDVVVRYGDHVRDSVEAVERIPIATPTGSITTVGSIARVERDSGPNYILRENVSRRIVVTANVRDGDVRSAVQRAKARLDASVDLPQGVRIEWSGQFEREAEAQGRLLLFGALSLIAMGFVISNALGSGRRALIVLSNLPLALAGGVVGVYIAGGVFSVATTIGFITLFGIAARNGILLATRYGDLEQEGVGKLDAVRRASRERLSPILMTAITAALGLLPLALALGQPGSEIQAPMALVILTGLVTSTSLNMFVVPVMLVAWGGARAIKGELTRSRF